MYCVKCGQATYDAKYCDKCRCVFCPDSPKDCQCSPCTIQIYSAVYCPNQQLPGKQVCYLHYCPVCLSEHYYANPLTYLWRYCSGCFKFNYNVSDTACRSCRKIKHRISPNFNCYDCECFYCDNIHCIEHKCMLCDRRIWFNDTDYCVDHACQRCMYAPAINGRFCVDCSVNRIVGTQTKRAN